MPYNHLRSIKLVTLKPKTKVKEICFPRNLLKIHPKDQLISRLHLKPIVTKTHLEQETLKNLAFLEEEEKKNSKKNRKNLRECFQKIKHKKLRQLKINLSLEQTLKKNLKKSQSSQTLDSLRVINHFLLIINQTLNLKHNLSLNHRKKINYNLHLKLKLKDRDKDKDRGKLDFQCFHKINQKKEEIKTHKELRADKVWELRVDKAKQPKELHYSQIKRSKVKEALKDLH